MECQSNIDLGVVIVVVVTVHVLAYLSIRKAINQLQKCWNAVGCFISFERNLERLRDKMDLITARINLLETMIAVQEYERFSYTLEGNFTRNTISSMDKMGYPVKKATSNVGHLVRFNTNVGKLRNRIEQIHDVIHSDPRVYSNEEQVAWLRKARGKAIQLTRDAGKINNQWFRRWTASGYRLSKEVQQTTSMIDQFLADFK